MKMLSGKKYNTKEDLQNKFFGIENYKPHKDLKDLFIRATSGTTTGAPTLVARRFTLDKLFFKFYGYIRACLLITTKNDMRLILVKTALNPKTRSSRILSLDKKDIEHPMVASLIEEFEPEVIHSIFSVFNFFLDKLYNKKIRAFSEKIKNIDIIGEIPPIVFLNKVKKIFKKSETRLFYGVAEAGVIGTYCKYLPERYKNKASQLYHPVKNLSIVAIDKYGKGEIAIHTPELSNYLTGDAGKIIKERCKCGKEKTLIFYGRINYDIVNCAGAVFYSSEVERVFSSLKDYILDYILEIKEIYEEGKTLGLITIKLIPRASLISMKNGNDFISEFIKKHLQLTKTRYLDNLVKDGIFLPPEIKYVSYLEKPEKKIFIKKILS